MTKNFIFSLFFISITIFAQWSPIEIVKNQQTGQEIQNKNYLLDIVNLKETLANAPLESENSTPIEIILPDAKGKMHRFIVYSKPVVEKKLAQRYNLESYVGIGIDDKSLSARFSLSGNDFQAMIIKDGKYEFIEPSNIDETIYSVFEGKNKNKKGKILECKTSEHLKKKNESQKFHYENQLLEVVNGLTISTSDRKFRTYRIAIATTGEYTQTFGGKKDALAQINATMTKVNGIFERDLGINLILIENNDEIVYDNPNTDPFSSNDENWSKELQTLLNSKIRNDNYDLGLLFAVGNLDTGDSGCIGCICSPHLDENGFGKGSAYVAIERGKKNQGHIFDIGLVAHEIGHQLGANHTFSFDINPNPQLNRVHMEPYSGTTIMSYGENPEGYFHTANINEILINLRSKPDCGTQIDIANKPPVITPPKEIFIPKSTAFALKADAIDNENDPLTYNWEQVDNATTPISELSSESTTGPLFRSVGPDPSPIRYFPDMPTILSGKLSNKSEVIPTVARDLNFHVTVRDNHPIPQQQQLAIASQKIKVIDTEPFTITSSLIYNNGETTITWNPGNTSSAPFNVDNVKIDYSTDNGTTWITLLENTPNDGSEDVTFPNSLAKNSTVFVRVSAIENIFFAINKVMVSDIIPCGYIPKNISTFTGTNKTVINWNLIQNAQYKIKYKNPWTESWTENIVTTAPFEIENLVENSLYEVQVAAICNGITSEYSDSHFFFTKRNTEYCKPASGNTEKKQINNITIIPANGTPIMNSTSNISLSYYSDYRKDISRIVYLEKGSENNNISVKITRKDQEEGKVKAWIDFNGDGYFSKNEVIITKDLSENSIISGNFSVPNNAYSGDQLLAMRVIIFTDKNTPQEDTCGTFTYETEDFSVKISPSEEKLNTEEKTIFPTIKIYPNPATDWLYLQNTSTSISYTIYNMAGQIALYGKTKDSKINISRLPKGTYIISFQQNKERINIKFIKN